jgi:hypothetical protein
MKKWKLRQALLVFRICPEDARFTRTDILSKEISTMRSDLVFGALSHVSNRYQLCQLASKATRKLHKPNTRLQDTTNEVLGRFQTTNPGAVPAVREADFAHSIERRRAA